MNALPDMDALRRSTHQPEAFRHLFERHHAAVHNYARRRLGPSLADDIAAEAFVRAFRARARVQLHDESARPWLLGICSKLILEHRRHERRALRAWERLARRADGAAVDGAPAEVSHVLIGRLRGLSSADREALLLLAWGELSYEEIAHAMEVPIGTVRSRINRARRQLGTDPAPILALAEGEIHA